GYQSYPTQERIYPEHKSPLEQRLDEYFLLEKIAFGNEMMEELAKSGYLPTTISTEAVPGGFNAKAFINTSGLVSFDSWSREVKRPWEIDPVEDYHQTIGPPQMLKLNPQASIEEIRKSVGFGVKQIVRSDPTIRSKAIDWV